MRVIQPKSTHNIRVYVHNQNWRTLPPPSFGRLFQLVVAYNLDGSISVAYTTLTGRKKTGKWWTLFVMFIRTCGDKSIAPTFRNMNASFYTIYVYQNVLNVTVWLLGGWTFQTRADQTLVVFSARNAWIYYPYVRHIFPRRDPRILR